MEPQQWEGFAWADLAPGMYIRWSAPDRGFGGMGTVTRQGFVRKVSPKSAEVLESGGTSRRISRSTFQEYETQRLTNKPGLGPTHAHTPARTPRSPAMPDRKPPLDEQHLDELRTALTDPQWYEKRPYYAVSHIGQLLELLDYERESTRIALADAAAQARARVAELPVVPRENCIGCTRTQILDAIAPAPTT